MYEVQKHEMTPDNFIAGDFPIVTDHGKIKPSAIIRKYAPLVQGKTGIEELTAEMITAAEQEEEPKPFDLIGIAADNAKESGEVVYYLTGEFFASALCLADTVTAEKVKPYFRKIGIYLKD